MSARSGRTLMRAPFALGDEAELRGLVEAAGFVQTRIRRAAAAAVPQCSARRCSA
jgi:hypothetical protein